MRFYTAQFSQVRYLEPYMLPFSTAAGEPAWFHEGQDRSHIFVDKRGVVNGLIAEPFLLDVKEADKLFASGNGCSRNCKFSVLVPDCPFMKLYWEQLEKLDLSSTLSFFNEQAEKMRKLLDFKEEPVIILLVYENAGVACAERPVIQKWFRAHDIEIEEWTRDTMTKERLF